MTTPRWTTHPRPLDAAEVARPGRRGLGRAGRLALLLGLLVAGALFLARLPPLPQPPAYLDFADGRTLLGVPRALDVLSNLPFAAVGLLGLWLLGLGAGRPRVALRDPRERAPWLAFFAGVALTSLGSAWFHLDPSLDRLVWDRLPMTIGFMGLLAALVAERIDARAGARLLWPLLLAGAASVAWWWGTEQVGRGDLRPYYLVQFYPLAAVPLVLTLFPRPARAPRRPGGEAGPWLLALLAYGLAKLAEAEDGALLAIGGVLGGHTLKHLLAAAGVGCLAWMLARRRAPA
jgi:hypothetical protein